VEFLSFRDTFRIHVAAGDAIGSGSGLPAGIDRWQSGSAVQTISRAGRVHDQGEKGRRRQFAGGRHGAGYLAEGAQIKACGPNFSVTGRINRESRRMIRTSKRDNNWLNHEFCYRKFLAILSKKVLPTLAGTKRIKRYKQLAA
jgi:hypothetical protein